MKNATHLQQLMPGTTAPVDPLTSTHIELSGVAPEPPVGTTPQ